MAAYDITPEVWHDRIAYHPADTPERVGAHEAIRGAVKALGDLLLQILPASREKSEAFTHLDDVGHWANKAVAMHYPKGDGTPITQEQARAEDAARRIPPSEHDDLAGGR